MTNETEQAIKQVIAEEKKSPIWQHRRVQLEDALERAIEGASARLRGDEIPPRDHEVHEMLLVVQARLNAFMNEISYVLDEAQRKLPNNAYGIGDFLWKLQQSLPSNSESYQGAINGMRMALYEIDRDKIPIQESYDQGFEDGYRQGVEKAKEARIDSAHLAHIDLE